ALIGHLQSGDLPISEPDLDRLITSNGIRQTFTSRAEDLAVCDVVYISTDVPTDDDGVSDLAPVKALIDLVAGRLGSSAVLVVLCQVPPGFCRGLTAVPHDRLIYQVET